MKQVFAIALLSVAVPGYTQAPTATPPPELQKVAHLVGSWRCTDTTASGAKATSVEENQWMDGGFFLVMNGKGSSSSSVGYMGYDADSKMYTYDEFDNRGRVDHSVGSIEGDTWTWRDRYKKPNQTSDSRFILKVLSPTAHTFKYVTSTKGERVEDFI